jgi:hypothetical protein
MKKHALVLVVLGFCLLSTAAAYDYVGYEKFVSDVKEYLSNQTASITSSDTVPPATEADTTSVPGAASAVESAPASAVSAASSEIPSADVKAKPWSGYLKLVSNTEQCLADCEAVIEVTNPTDKPLKLGDGGWNTWYVKGANALDLQDGLQIADQETEDYFEEIPTYSEVERTLQCDQDRITYESSDGAMVGVCRSANGSLEWSAPEASIRQTEGKAAMTVKESIQTGSRQESRHREVFRQFVPSDRVLQPGESVLVRISGSKVPTTGENNVDWRLSFMGFEPDWAWWNGSWAYRKNITVTDNSGGALTDYQVNFTVDTQTLISGGKMQSNCSDLRFVNSSGAELKYYIESACNTASTFIWVKVPRIPAYGTEVLGMYYGNPSAPAKSSGDLTFVLFDDFSTLNATKWNTFGTVYSSGGTVLVNGTSALTSIYSFPQGNILECRDRMSIGSNGRMCGWRATNEATYYYNPKMWIQIDTGTYLYAQTQDLLRWTYSSWTAYSTYYVYRLDRISSTDVRYIVDGNQKYRENVSGYIHTGNGYPTYATWEGGQQIQIDWMRVRKYASATPTAMISGETTPSKPSFASFSADQYQAPAGAMILITANITAGDFTLDKWWTRYNNTLLNITSAVSGNNLVYWNTTGFLGTYNLTGWVNDTSGYVNPSSTVIVSVYNGTAAPNPDDAAFRSKSGGIQVLPATDRLYLGVSRFTMKRPDGNYVCCGPDNTNSWTCNLGACT